MLRSSLTFADNALVYAVGHRRGESIHTYIATHGSTQRGRDQRHKDDVGLDNACGPPRKCPRILNDWSQAQPHIDKHNRWRQYELAIEERFRTRSFPFRLFTTVIAGMSLANAWALYQYHINGNEYESFRDFASEIAFDAMTNTYDKAHERSMADASMASPTTSSLPSSAGALQRSSESSELQQHVVVSIRSVTGWRGAGQQRCCICSGLTRFCCNACSTQDSIVALHPKECNYGGSCKKFGCSHRHSRNPEGARRIVASAARSNALRKRRRDNR